MGITEILRRIWLFSANKVNSSEPFSKQPTQLIVKLNSSLRLIIVTLDRVFQNMLFIISFSHSENVQKFCENLSHGERLFKRGIKIQFFFPFDCPYWPLVEVELYFDLGEVYKLAGRFFTTLVSFEEDPPDLWATLTNCSK